MTSEALPHGADEHPEVAEISDLCEGILSVERSDDVRAHLADCTLCADVRDSLDEIRSSLGTLPGPVHMPTDVYNRIDAALAAEALLGTQDTTPGPVSRETPKAGARGVSRETRRGPGAPTRPPGQAPGATGPGRRNRMRHHRGALLTTAGVVAALGLGGAVLEGVTGGSADPAASGAQRGAGEGAGIAAPALEERVRELLAEAPGDTDSQPSLKSETGAPENAPFAGPAVLPACVRAGIGRPEQPLAAEPGRPYSGRPSYLVVLPHPGDPQRVDAYVVDSSCTTNAASGPGEVLVERTYTRQ